MQLSPTTPYASPKVTLPLRVPSVFPLSLPPFTPSSLPLHSFPSFVSPTSFPPCHHHLHTPLFRAAWPHVSVPPQGEAIRKLLANQDHLQRQLTTASFNIDLLQSRIGSRFESAQDNSRKGSWTGDDMRSGEDMGSGHASPHRTPRAVNRSLKAGSPPTARNPGISVRASSMHASPSLPPSLNPLLTLTRLFLIGAVRSRRSSIHRWINLGAQRTRRAQR